MTTTSSTSGATVSQTLLDTMNGTSKSSSASSSSSSGTSSASSLQDTFLQLLVAQLKNQDPTAPMDSSQMTSQLAEINTVSGIGQLNTTLSSLASQLSAQQGTQSANLIGATVLTPGSSLAVSGGATTAFGVTLTDAATDVKVNVTNAAGKVVNTLDLGKQSAGTVPLTWTPVDASGNTLADGTYTISATATVNGSQTTPATVIGQQVAAVLPQSSGSANLVMTNGNTANLSSVAGIL